MSSILCTGCGYANGVGARFCAQCGSSLAPRCVACGAELSPAARFCSACGVAVEADPVGVSDGTLKVVSVVFSDLVGSTALQEALDTESVRRVMGRFYETTSAVVELHGGAIEKFIGDAVVVVFGTPVVREDDALRAVRCAAAMVDAVEVLNEELERTFGVRLKVRTGVNTGELVVNDEGILVGDTMNTAARFEQAAGAGEVLIGAATRRLVRDHVDLQELEPLALKGKSGPVRAWRVVAVGSGPATRLEAPLVGRASELDRLRSALEDAVTARSCRLVTVVGSPGLGKSRLAAEFARAVHAEATVVQGHCEPSGEGITFLPVAELLRAVAEIGEADDPETVVTKLSATAVAAADRDRVVLPAAGLLGAGTPAAPEETFWSVRRLLEAAAQNRPLVVVLDDVHWGQPMFLDLIEHLVEWVRDAPILLLALARPELREVREALAAAGRRPAEVIELEPLDAGESRMLVGGLLGGVEPPPALVERMLETTEGNPLFLGELLRMLVDEGTLTRSGDGWIAAGGADAVQVPPTIQALLTARIERLRADERAVVERAAVIGKQFYRGAVAQLVAPPIRSGIDGHLETLRRKDMVEPEGTYWIDEPVYRFHHVLLRDAAYHLLLKEARAELHERFADWLATKAGELVGEHEEVIAYHLEQAHEYRRQLGPLDDRGRAIGTRAAALLASAGRRALAREDLAAAANLLERALERDPAPNPGVGWDLGEALLSAGDTAQVGEVIERLAGEAPERAAVLTAQLAVLTGSAALDEVRDSVGAATGALEDAGDLSGAAKGHHVTAQVQAQLGRVADVEGSLDQALVAARRAEDRRRITAVLAAAPRAALWGPSPVVRASGRCLDVVRILRMTPGNRHVEAVALRCQAVLEAMRGRADAAREILASGRATLEELGLTLELHELSMHVGIVELLSGDPVAAETWLREAREGFAALGVVSGAAQAAALLARALVEQRRPDEAIAETEFAKQHAGGDLKSTITWLGVRAEALSQRGSTEEALELARRAVALAEPTDALPDKADANLALARVLLAAGRTDEGHEAAAAAGALYGAKDHAVGVRAAAALTQGSSTATTPEPRPVQPTLGDRPPERLTAEYMRLADRHDVDGLAALYHEHAVMTDHRQIGVDEFRGREGARELYASLFEFWPGVRYELHEVLACDERVMVQRGTWIGTASLADAYGAQDFLIVIVVDDGRYTSTDLYGPDEREAAMARYLELGGRPPALYTELSKAGPAGLALPLRPIEQLLAQHVERFNAHDVEGMSALVTDGFETLDHRTVGIGGTRGRERYERALRSLFDGTEARLEIVEVLAVDADVVALRTRYSGDASRFANVGEFELESYEVLTLGDGHFASLEHFDNREGAIARYEELADTPDGSPLGDRPPERLITRRTAAWNRRDRAGLAAVQAPDIVLIDRRPMGWERHEGSAAVVDLMASSWALWSADQLMTIEEVLACDEHVIAFRVLYRGTAREGGGELEMELGQVCRVEGGLLKSMELFDADDRVAILARCRELGGTVLGDKPPERVWAEYVRRWASHDADAVAALIAEDVVLTDHRPIGWPETRGRDRYTEALRAVFAIAPHAAVDVDEVLACDDRTIALRATYTFRAPDEGIGATATPLGQVCVIEDGRLRRVEFYEPDDRDPILARFAELTAGDQQFAGTPQERWMTEYLRAFAAHDLDAYAALHTEDVAVIDYRPLAWPELHGRDAVREWTRSAFQIAPTARFDVHEILAQKDRHGVLRGAHVNEGGAGIGPVELPVGYVTTLRDGLVARLEIYEYDEVDRMLARFAQLDAAEQEPVLGDSPAERVMRPWEKFDQLYNERRLDQLPALYTPGYVMVDRRPVSWEELDIAALIETIRGFLELATDMRSHHEVIAEDPGFIHLRGTFRGHSFGAGGAEAGPVELVFEEVGIVREERFVRTELFSDPALARARYEELAADGPSKLAPAELFAEHVRRFNAHDIEGNLELISEDFKYTDRRAISLGATRGRDAHRETLRSIFAVAPDAQTAVEEILAMNDRVIAVRVRYDGHSVDGSGEFELITGYVLVVQGGGWLSVDQYEPDDTGAMLARYAELGGGQGLLGDRPPERWWAAVLTAYARGDLDGLVALYGEGWTFTDHRQLGWEAMSAHADLREFWRSALAASSAQYGEVEEVLACGDRVIAIRVTWRGYDAEHGGAFAIPVGDVSVIESGRCVSQDHHDPRDRDAMLVKYAELTAAGSRRLPAVIARSDEAFSRHDREALGASYAPEIAWVDRRGIGGEDYQGREAVLDLAAAVWTTMSPDVGGKTGDVLASDGRVVARLQVYRGTAQDGGGELELHVGQVIVVEDGLIARIEFWDPDDRQAMIARYIQLGGGLGKLGDRPPGRYIAAYLRCYGPHDLDALIALHSPEVVFIDHRKLGWEEIRGRDEARRFHSSVFEFSPDFWGEADEVIACDDHVIALRSTWRGTAGAAGGMHETTLGQVVLVQDGRCVIWDQYEAEDTEAMLARFEELRAGQ